jgi:hypothetical protein
MRLLRDRWFDGWHTLAVFLPVYFDPDILRHAKSADGRFGDWLKT